MNKNQKHSADHGLGAHLCHMSPWACGMQEQDKCDMQITLICIPQLSLGTHFSQKGGMNKGVSWDIKWSGLKFCR